MRPFLMSIVLGLFGASLSIAPAQSESLRIALVIANSNYTGMAELARCTASAALVRDTLRLPEATVKMIGDMMR